MILFSLSALCVFALPLIQSASVHPLKADESLYHATFSYSSRSTDLGNPISFGGGGANDSSGDKFALSGAWHALYNVSSSPVKGIRRIKVNGLSSGTGMVACLNPTYQNPPDPVDMFLNKFSAKVSQTMTASSDTLETDSSDCNFSCSSPKRGNRPISPLKFGTPAERLHPKG